MTVKLCKRLAFLALLLVVFLLIARFLMTSTAGCKNGLSFSYANPFGSLATIAALDCNGELAGQFFETISIAIQKAGTHRDLIRPIFQYEATARGYLNNEAPTVVWNNARELTVSLRPNDIEHIVVQQRTFNGIRINYRIAPGCYESTESSLKDARGHVALLNIAACPSTNNEFTYLYSVRVRKASHLHSTDLLVFRYKPSRYGSQFSIPSIGWSKHSKSEKLSQLIISVDRSSIDRIFVRKNYANDVEIDYLFLST